MTLGKAVRLIDVVLFSNKEYICLMRLHADRLEERIKDVASRFVKKIYQLPPPLPVHSAVKRQLRIRTIREVKVLNICGRNVQMRVFCDAETYVRTLCVDMSELLSVAPIWWNLGAIAPRE